VVIISSAGRGTRTPTALRPPDFEARNAGYWLLSDATICNSSADFFTPPIAGPCTMFPEKWEEMGKFRRKPVDASGGCNPRFCRTGEALRTTVKERSQLGGVTGRASCLADPAIQALRVPRANSAEI